MCRRYRSMSGRASFDTAIPQTGCLSFLRGASQWVGEFGGDTVSLPAQAGEVGGVFPFSRMKRFTVSGR
jgi:hypothetical protein